MKTCSYFLILGMAALPLRLHAQTNFPAAATNAGSPVMLVASASGQTNSPSTTTVTTAVTTNAPTGTNAASRTIDIASDSGVFKAHEAVYIGNVRVISAQLNMTCELLTATSSDGGSSRPDHIVAETNVVIDALDSQGKPVHATAKKAIYDYKVTGTVTNDTIELSGNPHIESHIGPSTGDPIIWDRVNNTVHAINPHMVIKETETPAVPDASKPRTNAPPPSIAPEKKPRE
jgi:lipopolysaccharide export system protein LptA